MTHHSATMKIKEHSSLEQLTPHETTANRHYHYHNSPSIVVQHHSLPFSIGSHNLHMPSPNQQTRQSSRPCLNSVLELSFASFAPLSFSLRYYFAQRTRTRSFGAAHHPSTLVKNNKSYIPCRTSLTHSTNHNTPITRHSFYLSLDLNSLS